MASDAPAAAPCSPLCERAVDPGVPGAGAGPPSGSRDGAGGRPAKLVLLVVGLGTLLSAASSSTVNLALPALARELGAPVDVAGWVVLAHLLAATVLTLVAGRLGDLVGHRRVYIIGFVVFGLASAGCGLASGLWPLVAARVAQGMGGAMVVATGPALLTTSFPGSHRGRALGALSTATYLGLTAGPPLGGWVVAVASWRWVFLVNVPVAVIVVALALRLLPRGTPRPEPAFDWLGALCSVTGLPLVLFALSRGGRLGWSSPLVSGGALVGLALLVAFVLHERRHPRPLLALGLFRSRVFSGAAASALGNYVAIFVATMLLPFYVTEGLGVPESRTGLVLSAQPLLMALVAAPAGRLSDRWGSRGLATLGMVILAVGTVGLALLGAQASPYGVMAWYAVTGLGTGIFISPNSSALMGSASRAQQGVAGGVMAVARGLGMMIGVALGSTVFVALGGRTGAAWRPVDFAALRAALLVAAGVSLAAAVAAAARGGPLVRRESGGVP